MKTLTTTDLSIVSGGASKNTELTTALTNIQSSIKDVASQKSSGGLGDPMMMMMMGLMMSQRNQGPTVVAAGAPAPASGPIVNISTRVRRGW
jgi:NaMN:DMB phosphoribosyltransferase